MGGTPPSSFAGGLITLRMVKIGISIRKLNAAPSRVALMPARVDTADGGRICPPTKTKTIAAADATQMIAWLARLCAKMNAIAEHKRAMARIATVRYGGNGRESTAFSACIGLFFLWLDDI